MYSINKNNSRDSDVLYEDFNQINYSVYINHKIVIIALV